MAAESCRNDVFNVMDYAKCSLLPDDTDHQILSNKHDDLTLSELDNFGCDAIDLL